MIKTKVEFIARRLSKIKDVIVNGRDVGEAWKNPKRGCYSGRTAVSGTVVHHRNRRQVAIKLHRRFQHEVNREGVMF